MNTLPTKTVSYAAEGISHLQLHTWAGDIEIVGHEDDSIKVEVYLSIRSILSLFLEREAVAEFDPEIYELHIEQIDSTLKITAKPNYFHPYSWFNFPQMAFRVYLPAAIHSNAKTFGGKISLRNAKGTHVFSTWGGNLLLTDTRGDLKGKTMGGKVEVIKCAGKVTVKTMGGNLFLSDNQGEITASTMGGNVSVLQHKGQLHATTWGGNINANDVYGGFECTTAGGNIRLHNMNGNIGASTKGGNISAHVLTIDQYAWFDTAGGKVNAALPLDKGLDLEVSANRIYHPPFQSFEGYATRRSIRGESSTEEAPILRLKQRVDV
ncbi:MAG: hypothetical protein R2822_19040 [Spirosomataceae bacterium]